MLADICTVSNYEQADDFVGLRFFEGKPNVVFPRGYKLSFDDKELRLDIIKLLATINKFSGRLEGENTKNTAGELNLNMPIQSYQYVIYDYLAHGYYTEKETKYIENTRGKINWKRTIQKETPQIDNGNVIYLNFITKANSINENTMIRKIHEYCVYESFQKIGWLYMSNPILPKKPSVKLNKKVFITVLKQALGNTFNNQKRMLFKSMINIISQSDEKVTDRFNASYGVYRFEYVWEGLIDYIFGIDNKEDYFPHAHWHIVKGNHHESSELKPDTIMLYNGKTYILDAKYYKYGITRIPAHLPASDSVQKQITYAEYAITKRKADKEDIYNAFIMPYESKDDSIYEFVSIGMADWIDYEKPQEKYKYILGILVDTKHLINTYTRHNTSEIENLSNLIESSINNYLS